MSGGFTPGLRTVADGVTAEASFLASEHMMVRRLGITLDADLVSADGSGHKVVKAGTVLGKVTATGLYGPYVGGASEGQTVTLDATAGTFALTFDGETTAAIAYNAAASAVQSALLALSNLQSGDVTVTGNAGGPYTVTFAGQYAGQNVPALVSDVSALEKGAGGAGSGTATVATVGAGGGSTVSDGREVAAGILLESVNLEFGDTVAGMLIHGSVLEARCTGVDAAAKSALSQIVFQ